LPAEIPIDSSAYGDTVDAVGLPFGLSGRESCVSMRTLHQLKFYDSQAQYRAIKRERKAIEERRNREAESFVAPCCGPRIRGTHHGASRVWFRRRALENRRRRLSEAWACRWCLPSNGLLSEAERPLEPVAARRRLRRSSQGLRDLGANERKSFRRARERRTTKRRRSKIEERRGSRPILLQQGGCSTAWKIATSRRCARSTNVTQGTRSGLERTPTETDGLLAGGNSRSHGRGRLHARRRGGKDSTMADARAKGAAAGGCHHPRTRHAGDIVQARWVG